MLRRRRALSEHLCSHIPHSDLTTHAWNCSGKLSREQGSSFGCNYEAPCGEFDSANEDLSVLVWVSSRAYQRQHSSFRVFYTSAGRVDQYIVDRIIIDGVAGEVP